MIRKCGKLFFSQDELKGRVGIIFPPAELGVSTDPPLLRLSPDVKHIAHAAFLAGLGSFWLVQRS